MILFLYGEETFQTTQQVKELKNKFLNKYPTGENLVEFDCDEICDVFDIISSLGEQSLFATKKMIIIKNFFAHTKAPEQKQIIKKLETVEDDVIIFFEENTVRANAVLFKWLIKNAKNVKEYKELQGVQLEKWIATQVKKMGGKIEPEAIKELILFVGNNLWQLFQEINKLVCYVDEGIITPDDIHNIVHSKIDDDIFKAVEAMASKNKNKALELFKKQMLSGDNVGHIFAMYVYQVRVLVNVGSLVSDGVKSQQIITKTLKMHPFVVQKAMTMVNRLSYKRVVKMHNVLTKIDIDNKSGKQDLDTALEMFIMKI
jgi:DNA polymerase-3 subunit delta